MGVIYTVFPYELVGELTDWLRDENCEISINAKPGRWPTLDEIRLIIEELEGYSVKYWGSVDEPDFFIYETAESRHHFYGGHSTDLIARKIADSNKHEFYFSKGSPVLVLKILERITKRAGSFAIVDDSSAIPLMVNAGDDAEKLWEKWLLLMHSDSSK